MKLLVILTLLFTVALAFELDQRQENRGGGGGNNKGRTRKRTSRPKQFKGEARATAARAGPPTRRPATAPTLTTRLASAPSQPSSGCRPS